LIPVVMTGIKAPGCCPMNSFSFFLKRIICVLIFILLASAPSLPAAESEPIIATFSIVAYDPDTGDFGVAVQSKYFAVGDIVPFAEAKIGALATQAIGNLRHGPRGMELLGEGFSAQKVIDTLIAEDRRPQNRQIGVVDAKGNPATYTGPSCLPWAGGLTGEHYAAQGNLLSGSEVVRAMGATFEAASGDLASRMVLALAAGQAAGGDARGRQSAAVLVVRSGAGYLGLTDRFIDLHVEDHPTPIRELRRLLDIQLAKNGATAARTLLSQLEETDDEKKAELIAEARAEVEKALDHYPMDDGLWWLAAEVRLLDEDEAGAMEAGLDALLLAPSWPRLPQATREELGLSQELIETLREDDRFDRLWESLAASGEEPEPSTTKAE